MIQKWYMKRCLSFFQGFGSASFWCGSGSGSAFVSTDLDPGPVPDPTLNRMNSNFFLPNFFSAKGNFELIIHVHILNKKRDFFKNKYSYNFGWFACEFFTIFFATRIRTFPEVDLDPAKWYGSNRIRIRNTAFFHISLNCQTCHTT